MLLFLCCEKKGRRMIQRWLAVVSSYEKYGNFIEIYEENGGKTGISLCNMMASCLTT